MERLGGGCFNSSLQYPARVDRTGIRARTPRAMLSQRAAQRSVVALRFGCWRVSHLLGGSDVGAFGGGEGVLIIHFKSRRASLVSYLAARICSAGKGGSAVVAAQQRWQWQRQHSIVGVGGGSGRAVGAQLSAVALAAAAQRQLQPQPQLQRRQRWQRSGCSAAVMAVAAAAQWHWRWRWQRQRSRSADQCSSVGGSCSGS